MSFWNRIRQKKYLTQIYISLTSTFVVGFILFSILMFGNVRAKVLDNEYRYNEDKLRHIKNNIIYMEELLIDMCQSLFHNNKIQTLLYSPIQPGKDDLYGKMSTIEDLSMFGDFSDYFHSITVFNRNNDKFYSSYPALLMEDPELTKILTKGNPIPKLTFISRDYILPYSDTYIEQYKLISMIMYENLDIQGTPESAVILNIKFNWLFKNLHREWDHSSPSILLMDNNGEIIYSEGDLFVDGNGIAEMSRLDNLLVDIDTDNILHSFEEINNRKSLISQLRLPRNGWRIMILHPISSFFWPVSQLGLTILIWTLFFILLSGAVTAFISRRLYKPLDILVREVCQDTGEDDQMQVDEIALIHNAIDNSKNRLEKLQKEYSGQSVIIKTHYMRQLLLYSHNMTEEQWNKIREKKLFCCDFSTPLYLAIVLIDDVNQQFSNEISAQLINKKVIINIFKDMLDDKVPYDILLLREYDDLLIIQFSAGARVKQEDLVLLLRGCQQYIRSSLESTVSICLSQEITNKIEISNSFQETFSNAHYRYSFGKNSFITQDCIQDKVKIPDDRNPVLTIETEKKLEESIMLGSKNEFATILNDLMDRISLQNYNAMMLSTTYIIQIIINTLNSKSNMLMDTHVLASHTVSDFLKYITLEEVKENLKVYVFEYMDAPQKQTSERHRKLIERVMEYINENYGNSKLYSQSIADKFNISATYMGRLFKLYTEFTISAYINEIRLNRASDLLRENSEKNIDEIMHQVGIVNSSYFYRLFKQKFGMTPTSYRSLYLSS